MRVEIDLDLTDMTEEDAESGGRVRAGWYRARLTDVFEDHEIPGNLRMEWTVTAGPYKGSKVKDTLWHPRNSDDADKAKTALKRIGMFGKRLGVIPREAFGGANVKTDWSLALGREMFIECNEKESTNKTTGAKGVYANIQFDGVHCLDDQRVPLAVRQQFGGVVTQEELDAAVSGKPMPPGKKSHGGGNGHAGAGAGAATGTLTAAVATPARPNYADL